MIIIIYFVIFNMIISLTWWYYINKMLNKKSYILFNKVKLYIMKTFIIYIFKKYLIMSKNFFFHDCAWDTASNRMSQIRNY